MSFVPQDVKVQVLDRRFESKVANLRMQAYERQFGPDVELKAVRWGAGDEKYFNIGAIYQGELISVLRVAIINDKTLFENMVLYPFRDDLWKMPVTVLHRAATHSKFLSCGLHSLLRFHAIQISKVYGCRFVCGTFRQGTERESQLREMGYEIFKNPNEWTGFVKSNGSPVIAALNLTTHGDVALQRLSKQNGDLIRLSQNEIDFSALDEKHRFLFADV